MGGGLHVAGKEVVKAMFTGCTAPLLPSARPESGGCPATGPQRAIGPLGGPAAEGPYDGDNGGAGLVGGCISAQARLHCGG